MRAWWQSLQIRERGLLMVGVAALALLLVYMAVLRPLNAARVRLDSSLASLEQSLVVARPQANAILAARSGGAAVPAVGPSLLALADSSARDAGLKDSLKSLTPLDDKRVKVDLEVADFDVMVAWIEKLDGAHGIDVVEWSVNRELVPGKVSSRMILNSNR